MSRKKLKKPAKTNELSDEDLDGVTGGATQIENGLISTKIEIGHISSLTIIGDNLDAEFESVPTGLKKKKGVGPRSSNPTRN